MRRARVYRAGGPRGPETHFSSSAWDGKPCTGGRFLSCALGSPSRPSSPRAKPWDGRWSYRSIPSDSDRSAGDSQRWGELSGVGTPGGVSSPLPH